MWLSQNRTRGQTLTIHLVSRPVASLLPRLFPRSPDKEPEVDPGGVLRALWSKQSSQRVWGGSRGLTCRPVAGQIS